MTESTETQTQTPDESLTTLWVRTEGVAMFPLLCAPKDEALAAGKALDTACITMYESEWAPCCRAPYTNVACIRDHFDDYDAAAEIIRLTAERAGLALPADVAGA